MADISKNAKKIKLPKSETDRYFNRASYTTLRNSYNDDKLIQLAKLVIPSTDTGTYDKNNPTFKPTMALNTPTIARYEELTATCPLLSKAFNITANRLIGGGFELRESGLTSDDGLEKECVKILNDFFFSKNDIYKILGQATFNALTAGNEWTEIVYSKFDEPIRLNHGDYKTVDFQRDWVSNKILLDGQGQPIGFWQYIENLAELYRLIGVPKETMENLKKAKVRLEESRGISVTGTYGFGLVMNRANYMLINKKEMVHLSFDNFNDNPFGMSRVLPCYDAVIQLQNVLNSTAEMVYNSGFKKMMGISGDKDTPSSQVLVDELENVLKDQHYKDRIIVTYPNKIELLDANGSLENVYRIPDVYFQLISLGTRVPREVLLSDGESNRATSNQQSSDFEKDIEGMRKPSTNYLNDIGRIVLLNTISLEGLIDEDNVDLYLPEIIWDSLIKEDEAIKREQVYKEWQLGLLSWGEARKLLEYDVVEEQANINERSEQYYQDVTTDNSINPSMQGAISRSEGQQFSRRLSKTYIQPGEEAPRGVNVQTGERGGKYYEDNAQGDKSNDAPPEKKEIKTEKGEIKNAWSTYQQEAEDISKKYEEIQIIKKNEGNKAMVKKIMEYDLDTKQKKIEKQLIKELDNLGYEIYQYNYDSKDLYLRLFLRKKRDNTTDNIIQIGAKYISGTHPPFEPAEIITNFNLKHNPEQFTQPGTKTQLRLEPKAKLDPKLNKYYNTKDVDYKKIAQKQFGDNIKTIPKRKINKVRDTLINGLVTRKNPKKVLKKITEESNLEEYEAKRIAMTELKKLKETGKYEEAQRLNATYKKWNAILDNKTSNISKALNGQIRKVGETFKIKYTDESGKSKSWSGLYPPEQPNCYDDKTEVYTSEGWLLFKDLKDKNVKIWSLNPDTLNPEWQSYKKLIKQKSDHIVEYKGKSFDLAVTKNHHQFVKFREKQKGRKDAGVWKLVIDDELPNHDFSFYKSVEWKGKDESKIKIGNEEYDTLQFCKFMGWYLSEGSSNFNKANNRWLIKISQTNQPNLDDIFIDCLDLTKNVYLGKDAVWLADDNLGEYCHQFGVSYEKSIPDEIKQLDKKYLIAFLDRFRRGDGSLRYRTDSSLVKTQNPSIVYTTSSDRLASDLGELIMKIGKSPYFTKNNNKVGDKIFIKDHYATVNHEVWIISQRNTIHSCRDSLSREVKNYSGYVYDVELEKYHILLVRRNGQIVWSGNTRDYVEYYKGYPGKGGRKVVK